MTTTLNSEAKRFREFVYKTHEEHNGKPNRTLIEVTSEPALIHHWKNLGETARGELLAETITWAHRNPKKDTGEETPHTNNTIAHRPVSGPLTQAARALHALCAHGGPASAAAQARRMATHQTPTETVAVATLLLLTPHPHTTRPEPEPPTIPPTPRPDATTLLAHLDQTHPTEHPALILGTTHTNTASAAYLWHPTRQGNLALLSNPGWGRTSLARALLAQLLRQSPRKTGEAPTEARATEVHVIGRDLHWHDVEEAAVRMMSVLVGAPHLYLTETGPGQAHQVAATITDLAHLITRSRAAGAPPRWTFLVIDDVDQVLKEWSRHLDPPDQEQARLSLTTVLEQGPGAGVYTLATARADRCKDLPGAFGVRVVAGLTPEQSADLAMPGAYADPLTPVGTWYLDSCGLREVDGAHVPPCELRDFLSR